MKLYPCTKQPPCTNVTGHRTPVCPNDTSKNKLLASKLKTEAMLEHEPARISYHNNGKVAYEKWEPGRWADGLLYRSYYDTGKLSYEAWEEGKGPGGLESREYWENGNIAFEKWEPGKGPDDLFVRRHDNNGQISYEGWKEGKSQARGLTGYGIVDSMITVRLPLNHGSQAGGLMD